jgi:hypothetical protein
VVGNATGDSGADPFDRIYLKWASHALGQRLDPPGRAWWDRIVQRLVLSRDPDRIARYRNLEAIGDETLGGDAYELWRKSPEGTPDRVARISTQPELEAYAASQHGSMRRMMEREGQGERYAEIIAAYEAYLEERRARIKKGQQQVLIIGCAGMGAIVIMMLTVFLIIALQMAR